MIDSCQSQSSLTHWPHPVPVIVSLRGSNNADCMGWGWRVDLCLDPWPYICVFRRGSGSRSGASSPSLQSGSGGWIASSADDTWNTPPPAGCLSATWSYDGSRPLRTPTYNRKAKIVAYQTRGKVTDDANDDDNIDEDDDYSDADDDDDYDNNNNNNDNVNYNTNDEYDGEIIYIITTTFNKSVN